MFLHVHEKLPIASLGLSSPKRPLSPFQLCYVRGRRHSRPISVRRCNYDSYL